MKSAVRRARSKSPFQRPRKAEELINDLRDFEAKQRLISNSPEHSKPIRKRPSLTGDESKERNYSQFNQRRSSSTYGSPEESAAIEVVLEMAPAPSRSFAQKQKPVPAPAATPDLPELGTISTASSSENSPDKSVVGSAGRRVSSARKSFKEKYMAPPREAALDFASKRCFPFNHVGHMQQPKLPPSTPSKTAVTITDSGSPSSSSPPISASLEGHPTTPGRSRSRGQPVTRVPFRAPEPTPVTSSRKNMITPTRSRKTESVVVLSPNREARRRSRSGSVRSSAETPRAGSTARPFPSTPPGSSTGSNSIRDGNRSSSQRKLIESPIKPAREVPKILSRFTAKGASKQAAKSSAAPLRSSQKAVEVKMDEKKEDEEPPSELVIPSKEDSPISLLRSKPSMLSEISNPSQLQEDNLSAMPDSEVKRVLRSIEASLAAAANSGKHIDRQLVYKTLLEVSNSLESEQEREAMQRELSLLMENSNQHSKDLEQHQLMGEEIDKEDAPLVKKMVRIQSPQPGDIQVTPTMYGNMGEEDSWTVDTYGSQVSKDDTVNFLQEMFGFGFWGSKKSKPSSLEDSSKCTQEDWSEFSEDQGLKFNTEKNSKRSVPMLRTYSEETDESAFVSRSPSIQTGEQSSSSSGGSPSGPPNLKSGFIINEKVPFSTTSDSIAWWRQDGSPSSSPRSPASTRQDSSTRMPKGSQPSQKNLVDPATVSQPRETRRKENSLWNQSNADQTNTKPLRKPSGAGCSPDDTMSLSSIESNQYDRYATDFFDLGGWGVNNSPPVAPSTRDGRTSVRGNRQRSKSLDSRRKRQM